MPKDTSYTAENIQVLEGLEPVRKRPGMYIGSTDEKGLHHLFKEIVDNSVDEALVGYGKKISVSINIDGSLTVEDEGRGIPTDINPKHKVSGVELAMTRLHAGGKFDAQAYAKSGGLHGVGAAATNALSTWLIVEVQQKGKIYRQSYKKGVADGPLKEIGKSTKSGTKTTFLPDPEIFSTVEWNYKTIKDELRNWAYLVPNLLFNLQDERTGEVFNFYFEGGIKALVAHMNVNKQTISDVFYISKEIETSLAPVGIEVALQYNSDFGERLESFVNIIKTPDGGMHVAGFRSALTRAVNDYGKKIGAIKDGSPRSAGGAGQESFIGDDLREGLVAVIYVKMAADKLQFESQTKTKLNNAEIQPAVASVVKEGLDMYFEENPRDGRAILDKVFLAAKARLAARAAKEAVIRKGALEGSTLPGTLADCQSKDPANSELFIVEGDSAGGCFSGETRVALVDGRSLSFIELIEEQNLGKTNYGYTIRRDGKIGIEKLENVRLTKKQAAVIEVELDNGEKIICTPEHLFMLKSGGYEEAKNLSTTDSLMPLYRKYSTKEDSGITIDGYEMVWDPKSNTWLFSHMISDWYNLWQKKYKKTQGTHCHHIDFNKLNNNPNNIIRLSKVEHLELHRTHVGMTLHRPEVKEKSRKIRQSKEFRAMMSQRMKRKDTSNILSANAKEQWQNPEYKKFMGEKWAEYYKGNSDYRLINSTQLKTEGIKYWSSSTNKESQSKRVEKYFADHPETREMLSNLARKQWTNPKLLSWRKSKTQEQWTTEFREKRLKALKTTYFKKTIQALKKFESAGEINLDAYKQFRISTRDKSILRFDTYCKKYFLGDEKSAIQTVSNYNHKIVSVKSHPMKIDVYDLEVTGTHNFALASGVFVHNSAKQGRDRKFQAILPLFGKVLNTERARIDQIIASDKFKNLIIAVGAGISDQFNIEKLRYHKVIIMADADVDGSHIKCLYLTFFYRHLRDVIQNGFVYIAMPPLYKVEQGSDKKYFYTEEQKDTYVKTLNGKKVDVQRYKGLGEMNAVELWETTMNPENRVLKHVTIADAAAADATFQMLMGEDVPPRKRFIQSRAKSANLDI